jgi:hypothetical protein
MCDRGKITEYTVLIRTVSEAVSVYISKITICAGEGQKLDDTVLSVVYRKLSQSRHIYQAIFVKV